MVRENIKTGHLPGYLKLGEQELKKRADKAYEMLSPCRLCPRACGVDRLSGERGFCEAPAEAYVSSHNTHRGEEPPLSGHNGSGTIFFTYCNLHCVFCQNYPISHLGHGEMTSTGELAEMMLALQGRECHNINFVTPTHYVHEILAALVQAREKGLKLPLVYNSSGYDSVESLRLLDGVVDIYLPDMKYSDSRVALQLSQAPDYIRVNQEAIKQMHRQVGELQVDDQGIATRGLIIRHLVLPGGLAGSDNILEFIAKEISRNTHVSLMSQFFPAYRASEFAELNKRVEREVFEKALDKMKELGLPTDLAQYY